MDWLRIGAFGLLILYHIGMYFVPWGWHVKIAQPIDWAEVPMMAVNPWRLALLFAVSGYASAKLLVKLDDPGRFVGSRTTRLLIPLAFGMAVIVPPQPWIELVTQHGYTQGFAHFWMRDYFRFGSLDDIILPTWNHLWFVAYLWCYSVVLGLGVLLIPARLRSAIARITETLLSGPFILVVPMALLALQEFVLLPGADETHALYDDIGAHIVFLPIFLFGYLLAGSDRLWQAIRAHWRIAGIAAILAYVGVVADRLIATELHDELIEALRIVQGWGAIVALIGLADHALNRDHPWRATLTEAVFPFYIIHQTIIVILGWQLAGTGLPALAQFAILLAATVAGCWFFYRGGRAIPGLRPLIGLKGLRPPPKTTP